MHWDSEKNLNKLKEMLDTGEKLLVYHHDADGICAAALLLKFFPKMKSMPIEGPRLDSRTAKGILSHGADVVIFVDLPVDQEFEKLMQIKKKAMVAVIDHHIPERDLSRWSILHINPKLQPTKVGASRARGTKMEKDVYLPASYMVYKLMEKLGKKPAPYKWVSCIGIYGDYGFSDCASFLSSCEITRDEMKLGAELLSSAVTMKGLKGSATALKYLVSADSYIDFTRNTELKSWKKRVSREFNEIMSRFDGGKELYPEAGLVVYEIRSKFNLTSAVSNRLSELLPDFVVMIKKRSGRGRAGSGRPVVEWKLSLRCQSGRVNLGKTVKDCADGVGSGGGHVKAAGAIVSDYDRFFARLRSELKR